MGYTYYKGSVLIPNQHPLTFEDLAPRIEAKFSKLSNTTVELKKPRILCWAIK